MELIEKSPNIKEQPAISLLGKEWERQWEAGANPELQALRAQQYVREMLRKQASGVNQVPTDSSAGYYQIPISKPDQRGTPIKTIMDPKRDYYKQDPPITKEEDKPKEPYFQDGPGDRGHNQTGRDVPFAWESWGGLKPGAGLVANSYDKGILGSFKDIYNNAKIGFKGVGFFNSPLDDPGWKAVMAANNVTDKQLAGYFSNPGQAVPGKFADAMKAHNYIGLTAMDTISKELAKNSAFKDFSTFDKETGLYGFDRASYMGSLAANKDLTGYMQSITSINNARMTETMYGIAALNSDTFKGTPFAAVTACNLTPSFAYDIISAFSPYADKEMSFAKSPQFANKLEKMSLLERMHFVDYLKDNPTAAKELHDKSSRLGSLTAELFGKLQALAADSKADVGKAQATSREERAAAATSAAKQSLGLKEEQGFMDATKTKDINEIVDTIAKAYDNIEVPTAKTDEEKKAAEVTPEVTPEVTSEVTSEKTSEKTSEETSDFGSPNSPNTESVAGPGGDKDEYGEV